MPSSSSSSILFLNSVPPSLFTAKPSKKTDAKPIQTHPTRSNQLGNRHGHSNHSYVMSPSSSKFACRSSRSSSASAWISELDLYELLGVESSSNQAEIKKAYRALQKRCHPDIAGPAGHDMAIILNEVYSLLSDPSSRSAYDQEQSKVSEFKGYTGKPLYSTWLGSENEQRAVFVDEIKCVGCLKCALYANKTFAIESAYGRARVIAQWADPEDKILDAIQTCPVDCISMVERSDLAALEFLMSKQPRGNASMAGGNSGGGLRVSNIFADVNKFQNRFHEMKNRPSENESKEESEFFRNSRISAVRGIRSIYEWWYWRTPTASETGTNMRLIHIPKSTGPDTDKLREAAAKLKSRENAAAPRNRNSLSNYKPDEEYWTPMLTLPSVSSSSNSSEPTPSSVQSKDSKNINSAAAAAAAVEKRKWNPMSLRIPLLMGAVASVIVGNRHGEIPVNNLNEHIGGTVALEVVNSFELQVVLAATTWFVIGLLIVGVFEVLGGKGVFRR